MTNIQLSNIDARLVFLALQYHLARPGSELSRETKQPAASGLAEAAKALEPQLAQAVATIELDGDQQLRLEDAIAGTLNELKTYPLLAAAGGTTVPGFAETLQRLFPEVADDPEEAVSLAGHMMALRRRLQNVDSPPPSADDSSAGGRGWRFWQRKGS